MRRWTCGLVALAILVVPTTVLAQEDAATADEAPAKAVPKVHAEDATFNELYDHPRKGKEAFLLERGRFSLATNLFAQVQAAVFVGDEALVDNGDVANTEGFRLRRARIGLHGSFTDQLSLNVVLRLNDILAGGNVLDAANIVYRPAPFLNLAIGTAPLPFSRGSMTSSSQLMAIERPMSVNEMNPGSQLGVAVFGGLGGGIFEYAGGIYNGAPGYSEGDLGDGLLYAVRLQVSPFGPMSMNESDYEDSPFRMAIGGDYYYNNDSSVITHAASADLAIKWRGLSVLGEFIYDWKRPEEQPMLPVTVPDSTQRIGWYVQAGYFVIKQRLEIAGRYEWFDDYLDYDDAGDVWLASGGLNVYLMEGYLKLQFNFIHRDERNKPELANDIIFGQVQVNF